MKKFLFILLTVFGLCACGSSTSDAVAQIRSVNFGSQGFTYDQSQLNNPSKVSVRSFTTPAFNKLETSVGVEVLYHQGTGSQAEVKVTATKEYAKYLVAQVENGTMTVTWDQKGMRRNFKTKKFVVACRVVVTAPAPQYVAASSGSTITFKDGIDVDQDLDINVSSGASIEAGNLNAEDISISTSSGASFKATSAKCKEFKAAATSGSDLRVSKLVSTDKAELSASSGSDMGITSGKETGYVKANASSGATLKLGGEASGQVHLEASSGATVNASKLAASSAQAEASSGGSVHAPKVEQLVYKESSSGSVNWEGTPKVTKMK